MKFFALVALATGVLGATDLCRDIGNSAKCCNGGVGNLLEGDCIAPVRTPLDSADFHALCAADGRTAQCCVIPVSGVGLLCDAAL
ncbi:hypothetical protein CDD81_6414 [Ophiocordyceps australis]|uniref:Hydrophobin n=1 Tax=Ophiocordyceps australis TaxID=1399860 RepID=A0A2C5X9G2_9HYPO|nr:hypothetical protein CDD81_6414 [Ophiocordyceps australis]